MDIFEGVINDKRVTILYEGNDRPCHMTIELLAPFQMVLDDHTFPNPKMLSSNLACDLGTGPARDFLHNHRVPRESQLWHLNHAGWAPAQPEPDDDTQLSASLGR